MSNSKNKLPSVYKDILVSLLLSIIIISILFIVYKVFGSSDIIDTKATSLFGAILALSGLMSKQYLLKENISYLDKWKKVIATIDEITLKETKSGLEANSISKNLLYFNNQASKYMDYVITEIKIIPVVPLLLVVLYGAALIGSNSQMFSLTCLGMMLILVSYLSQATITSNNLAIDTSDLDETIILLEDILNSLNKSEDTEQ
jgi:hypothetical protein